jgi:hypothetical protein
VKNWEVIADNLSKAGWSWGCVSAVDSEWRTIWIVDAHRDDGRRFVVRADEELTAFLELESAIRERGTAASGQAANCALKYYLARVVSRLRAYFTCIGVP